MEGVGVAHNLLKKKEKITKQIFDKATSVKTIYKQSSGTDLPSHDPVQPYVIIFWTQTHQLSPQRQLRLEVHSKLQLSWRRKKISARPYMHSVGDTERGGIWYSCYRQPQTGTYSSIFSIVTRLLCIL